MSLLPIATSLIATFSELAAMAIALMLMARWMPPGRERSLGMRGAWIVLACGLMRLLVIANMLFNFNAYRYIPHEIFQMFGIGLPQLIKAMDYALSLATAAGVVMLALGLCRGVRRFGAPSARAAG